MPTNQLPPGEQVLVDRRRHLRQVSTDAERALWRLLRARQLSGAKFRRQHPVGPYILDFYCLHRHLAVELDGSQHYSLEGQAKDAVRTQFLDAMGVRVLRFSNVAVLTEHGAVLAAIWGALEGPSP